ncbi:MAG: DUF4445 domain-containing protein [Actinobacteria bacterium]|nr:DUF4445 domain-containing protein [Actinomycetota bacterium]
MDAALLAGVWIDAPCGGEGRCGKCRVKLSGETAPPTEEELEHLSPEELRGGIRLACQAVVTGPLSVEPTGVVAWASAKTGLLGQATLAVDLPELSAKTCTAPPLGAALDAGTTTLCVSLIDLTTGDRLAVASAENPQTRLGADVMTRIDRCRNDPDCLSEMQTEVTASFNGLLADVTAEAGRITSDIVRVISVGNTTMIHLLIGEDPSPLGSYPFEPTLQGPVDIPASSVGIEAAEGARLLSPRFLSGFLGADIVAVILVSGMDRSAEDCLVVDLGTNGEIAVGNRERMAACSTAAGPAFEGMQISSGMRAVPGAIESLSRNGLLLPRVLGGGEPAGICGSGLLDAVAALLEAKLLNPSGRLAPPSDSEGTAAGRIRNSNSMREFVLSPGSDITLTQKDIREFQLAKGAVRSGIEVLASRLSLEYEKLTKVFLAGVFGNFLKPASAVAVGLFPEALEGRIDFAGNAALLGAEMMLASEREWNRALDISRAVEVVELSGDPLFDREFFANLAFPASPFRPGS